MKKVFIAVLAYDFKVDTDCVMAVINNMEILKRNGIGVHLHFETGCCYLPIARNNCVFKFMASDCTDMVFVDSDVAFQSDAIMKLISPDKDIVCGLYPFKLDTEGYPARLLANDDGTYKIDPYTGLVEIEGGPTGLMRIQRQVIATMQAKLPETECVNDQGESIFSLFDTGMQRGSKQWFGEDYLFCLRWRDLGGKIWAEPDIEFDHIGRKRYHGNYRKYMETLTKKDTTNEPTNMAV